mmetsp:Transcript_79096/g.256093  ORF Transcript_79096/g.256093 Transcript_79096/m.256093 type:complete len:204 (-) Transcript_79096:243-854(-)
MQLTCQRLPWIVTRSSGDRPAISCSPSVFWVTQRRSLPCRCSSVTASCPEFGRSSLRRQEASHRQPSSRTELSLSQASRSTKRCLLGSFVQTPAGPLKSGTPESVEMPAPVSTTTLDAPESHLRASPRRPSGAPPYALTADARMAARPARPAALPAPATRPARALRESAAAPMAMPLAAPSRPVVGLRQALVAASTAASGHGT